MMISRCGLVSTGLVSTGLRNSNSTKLFDKCITSCILSDRNRKIRYHSTTTTTTTTTNNNSNSTLNATNDVLDRNDIKISKNSSPPPPPPPPSLSSPPPSSSSSSSSSSPSSPSSPSSSSKLSSKLSSSLSSSSSPSPSTDGLNLSLSLSSKPTLQSYGVFRENEKDDIKVMINNFTAPALARALRERESTLQAAAILAENGNHSELHELLLPFMKSSVDRRRQSGKREMDLSTGFSRRELVIIQRYLQKLPRELYHAADRRASVVIPLCNVNGVASMLFERRSSKVRTHKQQVCFPGGMVDEGVDATIIQTSLRELEEELGIPSSKTEVLGVLRCNWNEVASMTGIAVTPVVGYIGELNDLKQYLSPNPDEVEQLFTVPMERFLNKNNWEVKEFSTPVFTGGPFVIWGLTAYLLERFIKDVVMKCELKF